MTVACGCQNAGNGEQYEAIGANGALELAPGRTRGTREEARAAAAQGPSGAWVRKAA